MSSNEPARAVSPPVDIEILPGALRARVYDHDIASQHGPIACWTYVSDGLMALQHPEIAFTLRRDPGEAVDAPPGDPLRMFATVHQRAASGGPRLGPGALAEIPDGSFFGHHVVYVAAPPLDGALLPPVCLAALLVTSDELRVARAHGTARLLVRLGQASSHYPFPPWNDRRRRGLTVDRTLTDSLLSRLPRASAPDLLVELRDRRVTVNALRSPALAWSSRLAQLPADAPLAWLTAIDPIANGCLVWVPGQTGPEVHMPPGSAGSRVSACFLAVVPGQPASGGKILEDGIAMELTDDAWRALRSALADGTELAIPADGNRMPLALVWRSGAAGHVQLGEARLLTPLDEVTARVALPELAVFCQEIQRRAERVLGGHAPVELLLRARCTPDGYTVDLSSRGEISRATLSSLVEALHDVPRPPVQGGEVMLEVELEVGGGVAGPASARS